MEISADMAEPVLAVARFMARGEEEGLADAFASNGLVIVENFPPYIFTGPGAFLRWREGFIAHAARLELDALQFDISHAQEFSSQEDRAFFTLPVRWRGLAMGQPFDERGGWTFVLTRGGGRWRILCYAWSVTSKV
jgi:hypothetical protein